MKIKKTIFYNLYFVKKYKPISLLSFPFGWHSFVAIGARLSGVKNICCHAGNIFQSPKIKTTLR